MFGNRTEKRYTLSMHNKPLDQKKSTNKTSALKIFLEILFVAVFAVIVYVVLTTHPKTEPQYTEVSPTIEEFELESWERRFNIDSVEKIFLRFDAETGEIFDVLEGLSLDEVRAQIPASEASEWVRGDGVLRTEEEECNSQGLCFTFTFDLFQDFANMHILIYERENDFITFNKVAYGDTIGGKYGGSDFSEIDWVNKEVEKDVFFVENWSEQFGGPVTYSRREFTVNLDTGKMTETFSETREGDPFVEKI